MLTKHSRVKAMWLGALAICLVLGLAWLKLRPSQVGTTQIEPLRCDGPNKAAPTRYPGMVWVPPGQVEMGDTVYPEEQPVIRRKVDGFWMAQTEVTNAAFAEFVKATGYVTQAELVPKPIDGLPAGHPMAQPGAVVFFAPSVVNNWQDLTQWWRYTPGANWRHPGGPGTAIEGREHFPVVAITYQDALAYARWRGHQLPTEVQLEWAMQGGQVVPLGQPQQPVQANTWQGLFPVKNTADDGFVGLAPVGCFAPNAFGLFDTLGNVWELTSDIWTDNHVAPKVPDGGVSVVVRQATSTSRVIKGGSYLCAPNFCLRYRSAARQPQEDDLATSHLGFRTVLNAPGP